MMRRESVACLKCGKHFDAWLTSSANERVARLQRTCRECCFNWRGD